MATVGTLLCWNVSATYRLELWIVRVVTEQLGLSPLYLAYICGNDTVVLLDATYCYSCSEHSGGGTRIPEQSRHGMPLLRLILPRRSDLGHGTSGSVPTGNRAGMLFSSSYVHIYVVCGGDVAQLMCLCHWQVTESRLRS